MLEIMVSQPGRRPEGSSLPQPQFTGYPAVPAGVLDGAAIPEGLGPEQK